MEWDWCRAPGPDGTAILYEAMRRDGSRRCLALRTSPGGEVSEVEAPEPVIAPPTCIWRTPRGTCTQDGAPVVSTLEDTLFYARSVLAIRLLGAERMTVHERLALNRFRMPVAQAMLPFRVSRALR